MKTKLKERPIIFSTPMVKAILAGEKTQTRRVMNPQPTKSKNTNGHWWPSRAVQYMVEVEEELQNKHPKKIWSGLIDDVNPYGKRGDLLYVRETFASDPPDDGTWGYVEWSGCGESLKDIPDRFMNPEHCIYKASWGGHELIWKPSIHMPKKYARIWLKVKDIRVERLQDISEKDAMGEGIVKFTKDGVGYKYGLNGWNWSCQTGSPFMCTTAKIAFETLWDSINGKPRKNGQDISWDANPWVWAIEFERIER